MLLDFLTPAAGKDYPRFNRSRCLRMRHRSNGCDLCLRTCRQGAIDLTKEMGPDQEKCTSCFRCTAVCPTEALSCPDFDFVNFLGQIAAGGPALIGCAASRAGIRLPIPCIGLLSDAHLTALSLVKNGEIGIDIEPCGTCGNGEMVEVLKDRLANLPETLRGRIRLGADHESLPAAGRREFFAALKNAFLKEAATAMEAKEPPSSVAYSEKQLPLKRKLLNDALQRVARGEEEDLKEAFYFTMEVDEECTLCTTCSATCPTGALQRKKGEEGWALQFRSASCPGCGLCMDSCRRNAIRLRTVDPQTDVFAWLTLRREIQSAHQEGAGKESERIGPAKRPGC